MYDCIRRMFRLFRMMRMMRIGALTSEFPPFQKLNCRLRASCESQRDLPSIFVKVKAPFPSRCPKFANRLVD